MFIALSVILASTAVGIAGEISFVGLMAPHMARKLVGRTAFLPLDVPAGIFTAF